MLRALSIANVVLIEKLALEFDAGFAALTGETGAGKSILLDSLGLALGARSEASLVRKDADQAQVSAEFIVPKNHPVHDLLHEQGIGCDDSLVLRRIVGVDGRSRAFINDQPVSVGLLRQAGDLLVEIHGQFDTHGLLDPGTHRDMLDEYAGIDVTGLERLWQARKDAEKALLQAKQAAEKAKADEDYLRHAVKELSDLAPVAGEEQDILSRREALKHKEQILAALHEAIELVGGEDGADMAAGRASRALNKMADKIAVVPVLEALDRAGVELQAASTGLQSLLSRLDSGDSSLEALEDRLYALRGAARKYHCQPDELAALTEKFGHDLSLIDRQDDTLTALHHSFIKAQEAWEAEARKISAQRKKAAEALDKLVARELPPLKLDKARFETSVERLSDSEWGLSGMDRVQFLVATNLGSAPGPLNKIASGGEMARFMLALKVVMAEIGAAQTLVFDEVDTGIGGATASAVGERLARLAKKRQILVVTHSPQVAARAQTHFIVMKDGRKDMRTTVIPLSELHDRREEIARMLSGSAVTKEARAAAEKLLEAGA